MYHRSCLISHLIFQKFCQLFIFVNNLNMFYEIEWLFVKIWGKVNSCQFADLHLSSSTLESKFVHLKCGEDLCFILLCWLITHSDISWLPIIFSLWLWKNHTHYICAYTIIDYIDDYILLYCIWRIEICYEEKNNQIK